MNKKLLIFLLALLAVVLIASGALAARAFPSLGNYTNNNYQVVTFTFDSGTDWEDSTWNTVYTDNSGTEHDFQDCFNVASLWSIDVVGVYYIENFSDDVPALAKFGYTSSGGARYGQEIALLMIV